MASLYNFRTRSGKQCRERWHNHLDPFINKDYWTEKEESVLFAKHIEFGNKWSDIAAFLPGRTDNAIKNHFYSKLRKFIRKMLKSLNKDNLLKSNGIDTHKYNSDKIYKIIKKYKIPYNTLNRESILQLVTNFEKSSRNGKIDGVSLIKNKNSRSKKQTENLYDEISNNVYGEVLTTLKNMKLRQNYNNLKTSKTKPKILGKKHKRAEFNIIIDKNLLKEEEDKLNDSCSEIFTEEKVSSQVGAASFPPTADRTFRREFTFNDLDKFELKQSPYCYDMGEGYTCAVNNTRKNVFDYYSIDYPKPLISPINYSNCVFPDSTRNHFNIDMDLMYGATNPDMGVDCQLEENSDQSPDFFSNCNFDATANPDFTYFDDIQMINQDTAATDNIAREPIINNKDMPVKQSLLKMRMKNSLKNLSIDMTLISNSDSKKVFNENFCKGKIGNPMSSDNSAVTSNTNQSSYNSTINSDKKFTFLS